MSTRIIIEKDGERWEVTSDYAIFVDPEGLVLLSTEKHSVHMRAKELQPVIRTDNSEVIANLEAENAKLREALKPIMEFRVAPAKWIDKDEMYHKSFDAVRRAQAIIKGGAE